MTAAGATAVSFLLRRFCRPAVIAIALSFLTLHPGGNNEAQAVIEGIYTLPFWDSYTITCGFGCYWGHQGTDYQLGAVGAGGEAILAAASGTVQWFEQFPPFCEIPYCAGYYIATDHGNGHKTRYLHLNDRTASDGQNVSRGEPIGHEGNSGTGAYHLHFETRHNATAGDCCSGTAVDPYNASTYMWTTNPPSYPPGAVIEGTLVRGSGDPVYILSSSQKRHITSPSVLNACGYKWAEISSVGDGTLGLIPTGSSVTGPPCPYTLVRVGSTGPVYVIWGSYFKRYITSPAAFNACGYDWADVVSVSSVSGFTTGSDVNGPPCPYTRDPWYHEARMEGTLVQGSGDPVYILSAGQKRHIASPSVLNACGYKRNDVVAVPDSTLSLIPSGSSITGPPCPYTLIRGTSDPDPVYVMTQTLKHHITSRSVFDGCG